MDRRPFHRWPDACGLLLMILLGAASTAFPAEGNPPPGGTPDPPPDASAVGPMTGTGDESLMSLILDSGVTGVLFMVALGLFSLAGVSIAIERAARTRRSRILPAEFLSELQRLNRVHEARPEPYRLLCSQFAAPITSILAAGLLRAGRPVPEVEKSMEDAAAREMSALRSGIRPLSVIASVAPLVGLLGTVVGMIYAFRTASQAGLGKGELMAQGIYMALLTTAAGLTIAIPALLVAAWLNAKVDKLFREVDRHLMETMPSFARMEQTAGPAPLDAAPPRVRSPLVGADV